MHNFDVSKPGATWIMLDPMPWYPEGKSPFASKSAFVLAWQPCGNLCALLCRLSPLPQVLEQLDPWGWALGVQAQVGWVVRELPCEEAALRVGHHRQVASVLAAQGCDSEGGAVGVVGVHLRLVGVSIHISAQKKREKGQGRKVRNGFKDEDDNTKTEAVSLEDIGCPWCLQQMDRCFVETGVQLRACPSHTAQQDNVNERVGNDHNSQ